MISIISNQLKSLYPKLFCFFSITKVILNNKTNATKLAISVNHNKYNAIIPGLNVFGAGVVLLGEGGQDRVGVGVDFRFVVVFGVLVVEVVLALIVVREIVVFGVMLV